MVYTPKINDVSITKLAENCTNLENLILLEGGITDASVSLITEKLPNIKKLVLRCAQVTPLAIYFVSKLTHLTHLALLGTSGITLDHVTVIISGNPQLVELDLLDVKHEMDVDKLLWANNLSATIKRIRLPGGNSTPVLISHELVINMYIN